MHSKLTIDIDVKLSDSITAVKWIIYRKLYIPPSMQLLRFHEENLEDDKTIEFYKIQKYTIIFLEPKG